MCDVGVEAVSIESTCCGVRIVLTPVHVVDLTPYGARAWMEFSAFSGPFFFRGQYSEREIDNPSRKTWRAYEKWHREVIEK